MDKFIHYSGINEYKRVSSLAGAGMMIALSCVLALFQQYAGESFRLYSFTYLPNAVCAIMFGPAMGLACGFISDFLTYVIKPMGPYHPGFALSMMLSNIVFALFFYRRAFKLWKVFVSVLTVTLTITLGLNMYWLNNLYGMSAAAIFTGARFIARAIQFPVDLILVAVSGRLALDLKARMGREQ